MDCLLLWKQIYNFRRVCKCYEQHGIRHIELIDDRDSSVNPTLYPVYLGFPIKKLECAKHVVRCYHTVLENLVNSYPSYKGKDKLNQSHRESATIMRSRKSDKQNAVKTTT